MSHGNMVHSVTQTIYSIHTYIHIVGNPTEVKKYEPNNNQ